MSDILGESLLTLLALVMLLKGWAAHFPYIPSCPHTQQMVTLLIKFTMQSAKACVVGKVTGGFSSNAQIGAYGAAVQASCMPADIHHATHAIAVQRDHDLRRNEGK